MMLIKTYVYLLLQGAIRLYSFALIIYAISSFFVQNRHAKWYVFFAELCEPPIRWVRNLSKGKLVIGMIDLSILVIFFGLEILRRLLYYLFVVI